MNERLRMFRCVEWPIAGRSRRSNVRTASRRNDLSWPNAVHDDGPKSTRWRRSTKRDVFGSFQGEAAIAFLGPLLVRPARHRRPQ